MQRAIVNNEVYDFVTAEGKHGPFSATMQLWSYYWSDPLMLSVGIQEHRPNQTDARVSAV